MPLAVVDQGIRYGLGSGGGCFSHTLLQAKDGAGVGDGVGDTSEAAEGGDGGDKPLLIWCGTAAVFYLNRGEDCESLADHIGRDGDLSEADQVGAALA